MSTLMIEAESLVKRYGDFTAVDGVSLAVPRGTVLAVLGPNGAGKTTTVRMLTTLTTPDSGSARVAGHDVVRETAAVQAKIGVTAQDATVDGVLTGRQNLTMIGRLSGLRRIEAKHLAEALLTRFELAEAADRRVSDYSGGMRRRLDLAAGLVTRPPVLFLDEPTTGLDPTSRMRMWRVIRDLVDDGATLLLTTQYLEEADELADQILVVDHGKVVASGTATELKAQTGGANLRVTLARPHPHAISLLRPFTVGEVTASQDGLHLRVPVVSGSGLASAVVRALDDADAEIDDVGIHPPSLDDVFYSLTGHASTASTSPTAGRTDPAADPEDKQVSPA